MNIPTVTQRIYQSRDSVEIATLFKVYRATNGNLSITDLEPVLRAKVAKALFSLGKLQLVKGKGLIVSL